jgi:hypothetical protein
MLLLTLAIFRPALPATTSSRTVGVGLSPRVIPGVEI